MNAKIKMIVFILVCGTILTASLVFVDAYTTPIIQKNESLKLKRNVLSAFGYAYTSADIESVFAAKVQVAQVGDIQVYRNESDEIALTFAGSGLWGPITGIAALSKDLEYVRNLTIMHQEETPGLGSRIAEREHLDKFVNKRLLPALSSVGFGKARGETEVEAITGATMSSHALVKLLNESLSDSLSVVKGAMK